LSLPASAAEPSTVEPDALEAVARAFSPRVQVHAPHLVTLDVSGLGRLLGTPAEIGRELAREARGRGCAADVAIAGSRSAAMLLALACDGLTVAPRGDEPRLLANLPLGVLARLAALEAAGSRQQAAGRGQQAAGATAKSSNRKSEQSTNQQFNKSTADLPVLSLFRRWGLRTLGDLAALPAAALSERIGQDGLRWQRVARGEDLEPLVAMPPEAPIEEVLDLDWPVEGLEPLSFLLSRLLDPICERLERLDQAAVGLALSFRLATREQEARRIELPAPMRDAKVLRTLILLHLESHPLGAGVDRVAIRIEPAPARIVQFSLLARALPFPEQIATLLARLGALMGERRVGSPAIVDSHRPGAFAMQPFRVEAVARRFPPPLALLQASCGGPAVASAKAGSPVSAQQRAAGSQSLPAASCQLPADTRLAPSPQPLAPSLVLRRFRLPVPARVIEQEGRPVRVTTERRGLEGGRVEASAGPWRTSGEWWKVGQAADSGQRTANSGSGGWTRDEWDVALGDGALYRLYRDRTTERWFVEGILD
jgi:protein ImuB